MASFNKYIVKISKVLLGPKAETSLKSCHMVSFQLVLRIFFFFDMSTLSLISDTLNICLIKYYTDDFHLFNDSQKTEKYKRFLFSYCCKGVQSEEDNSLQLFAVWDFLTIIEAGTKRKYYKYNTAIFIFVN